MAGERHRNHEADEPLLTPEPSTNTSTKTRPSPRRAKRRTFVVEPLLALYIISGMPLGSVRSQFLYAKVQESMGVDLHNFSTDSCVVNLSNPDYILQQEAQAEAANWNMYLSLARFLPDIIMTVLFGIYSDHLGRRMTFILPTIGSLLSTLADMAVMTFNLPLPWLFLETIEYCFGGMMTLLMGSFAYIADTCDPEKRALRMTFLDCILLLVAGLGELIIGYVIKAQGFLAPLYYVMIGKVLTLLYAIFFIPESLGRSPHEAGDTKLEEVLGEAPKRELSLKNISEGFMLYIKDNGTGRRWKLNVLLFSYLIAEVFSTYRIMMLYEMDSPLCWDSVLIGYFGAVTMLIKCVMTLAISFFLRWRNIPEEWIAVISRVLSVIEYIYLAFVTTTAMMFFAPAIGCISFLAIPMTRALMSNMMENENQGAMFAVMTSGSTVAGLISTLSVNKIYAATLLFFRGFIFLFAAAVLFMSLTLILIYIWFSRDSRKPSWFSRSKVSVQA